jgi:hypothetical protein
MASTTSYRCTQTALGNRVTLPVAANMLCLGGTIACVDADGRTTPGALNAGLAAVGKYEFTVSNLSASSTGGAAGAVDAEIISGIFGWLYDGTAPKPGQIVFVLDNQTVTLDSNSGARGIAGYCSELREGLCWVEMGPTVAGQIVIAAAEAADLDQAQLDIDAAEADVDDLEADAARADSVVAIPLSSWLVDGAPAAAFADGTVNGLALVDSEMVALRVNPSADVALPVLSTSVAMPQDLDDAADVVLHVMACRIGSADTTTVLQSNAFFQTAGAAYDADADAITADTVALDAATKVVAEYTTTIAAADVPAAPANMTLTITPSAALVADDLAICATWLEYTRKPASA